jgi:hypothetical protein
MFRTTVSAVTAAREEAPGFRSRWRGLLESDLRIVLLLTVMCFLTRLVALPASMWEWDDILFASALHRFDMESHSPHPPGFPVFVMMGRAAYWVTGNEQLALAAVSVTFSSLLAGALFYFYRQVFDDRSVAVAGAVIGSFLPAVWAHSGAARSDEPAFVLGLICLALAINGIRSRRSLLIACAVLGLGTGVRLTVVLAAGPAVALALIAWLWRRQWRPAVAGIVLGVCCGLAWYVPLVLDTTPAVYRSVMKAHAEFAWTADSILANTENGILTYRLGRFFADIWGNAWIMWTIYGLSAMGIVALAGRKRWPALGLMAIAFLPHMIFTLVLNTPLSAPLYSLPYVPLFVGLAAVGLVMTPRRLFSRDRPALASVGVPLAFVMALGSAHWSYPVVHALRSEHSPPIKAIEHLVEKLDPDSDVLSFDGLFWPHVRFFMPKVTARFRHEGLVGEANIIDGANGARRTWALTLERVGGVDEQTFRWSSRRAERRLRKVSLGRYLQAHVADVSETDRVRFLDGWYDQEWGDDHGWRWMSRRGRVALLNVAEEMELQIKGEAVSVPGSGRRPSLVFRLDGVEVDRFSPEKDAFERTLLLVPDRQRLWSVLTIEADGAVAPMEIGMGDDQRELGLQCFLLRWFPSSGAETLGPSRLLGEGWYPLERVGLEAWRWTGERATVHLPPTEGDAELELEVYVPYNREDINARVRFERDGQVLDSFQLPFGQSIRRYRVPHEIHQGRAMELVLWGITIRPAHDQRDIAMRVHYVGWRPFAPD